MGDTCALSTKGKVVKVLFVCLGNICRSPAAEEIFRSMCGDDFEVDSAGTSAHQAGMFPDSRMREHAKKRGYILNHRCRNFSFDDFINFDLIVTMDNSNLSNLKSLDPGKEYSDKVLKMSDYCVKNKVAEVPDPYYKGEEGFEEVLDILEDSCRELYRQLTT